MTFEAGLSSFEAGGGYEAKPHRGALHIMSDLHIKSGVCTQSLVIGFAPLCGNHESSPCSNRGAAQWASSLPPHIFGNISTGLLTRGGIR